MRAFRSFTLFVYAISFNLALHASQPLFTQFLCRHFRPSLPTSFITLRYGYGNGHGLQRGTAWCWTCWIFRPLLRCLPLAASWQRKKPRILVLDRRGNRSFQAGNKKTSTPQYVQRMAGGNSRALAAVCAWISSGSTAQVGDNM